MALAGLRVILCINEEAARIACEDDCAAMGAVVLPGPPHYPHEAHADVVIASSAAGSAFLVGFDPCIMDCRVLPKGTWEVHVCPTVLNLSFSCAQAAVQGLVKPDVVTPAWILECRKHDRKVPDNHSPGCTCPLNGGLLSSQPAG